MIIYLFAVLFDAFSFSFSHIQKDKRVFLKAKVNKTQPSEPSRAETPEEFRSQDMLPPVSFWPMGQQQRAVTRESQSGPSLAVQGLSKMSHSG